MTTLTHPSPPAQQGVSLIELLVGMAVGLMTVLVITQVFLFSEEQRRVPASGANTQINGILALNAIQLDIRQAGYGLSGGAWLGCTISSAGTADAIGLSGATLAPVQITPSTSTTNPSDSITTLSSGKVSAAVPIRMSADHSGTATAFVVSSALSVEANDWLLASDGSSSDCHLVQVTAAPSLSASNQWEVPHGTDAGIGDLTAPAALSNLGLPVHRRWSVNADRFALQQTDLTEGSSALDAYPEVVLLRAFYGKDTNGDGSIDTYDQTAPTQATWPQVMAVRLAIVVRSPQSDREAVTTEDLQWNLGEVTVNGATANNCPADTSSRCVALPLAFTTASQDNPDAWKYHRYRIFDTMVPLRNQIWRSS